MVSGVARARNEAGVIAPPLNSTAEIRGPLSFRLFDLKGKQLDVAPIGVAPPNEYVTAEAMWDPGDGTRNVLEVKLSAGENFTGAPAAVELVLPPERIPDLLPGKKKGRYTGQLRPGTPLMLRQVRP